MEEEVKKTLNEIQFAVVKGDGIMAWTPFKPAYFHTEEEADDKLAMFKRLKHDGYRKLRVYYEELETPTPPYTGEVIEGVSVRRSGSMLIVLDAEGRDIKPLTEYHEIEYNPLAEKLIGSIGSMSYVLTPSGRPWTKGYQNIYKQKGILYGELGSRTESITSGNTDYYDEEAY